MDQPTPAWDRAAPPQSGGESQIADGVARGDWEPNRKIASAPLPGCRNCGAELTGPFCSQCGQEVQSETPSFKAWLLDYLGDSFAFDGRFLQTLKLLVLEPGQVAKAYCEGRKVRFVPPFRMYLFLGFFFFLLAFVGDSKPPSLLRTEPVSSITFEEGNRAQWFRLRATQIAEDPEPFRAFLSAHYSRLFLLLTPLYALLIRLFFGRQEPMLLHGFVHAFYLFGTQFLIMSFLALARLALGWSSLLGIPFFLVLSFFHFKNGLGVSGFALVWRHLVLNALFGLLYLLLMMAMLVWFLLRG